MIEMTERQKMLIEITIKNLNNICHLYWIEEHTDDLNYDWVEQDLWALADDLEIEFL